MSRISFDDDHQYMCFFFYKWFIYLIFFVKHLNLVVSFTRFHHSSAFFSSTRPSICDSTFTKCTKSETKLSCQMLCNCNGCSWTFHQHILCFYIFVRTLCRHHRQALMPWKSLHWLHFCCFCVCRVSFFFLLKTNEERHIIIFKFSVLNDSRFGTFPNSI